jgi:hypothetical protein
MAANVYCKSFIFTSEFLNLFKVQPTDMHELLQITHKSNSRERAERGEKKKQRSRIIYSQLLARLLGVK